MDSSSSMAHLSSSSITKRVYSSSINIKHGQQLWYEATQQLQHYQACTQQLHQH